MNSEKVVLNLPDKSRVNSPQGGEPEKLPPASPVAPSSGSSRARGVSILREGRRKSNATDSEQADERKEVRFSMERNVEVLAFEAIDWEPTTSRGPRRMFGGELGGGANMPPRAQTAGNIGRGTAAAGRLPAVYTSLAPRSGPSNAVERLGVRDLGALSPENRGEPLAAA